MSETKEATARPTCVVETTDLEGTFTVWLDVDGVLHFTFNKRYKTNEAKAILAQANKMATAINNYDALRASADEMANAAMRYRKAVDQADQIKTSRDAPPADVFRNTFGKEITDAWMELNHSLANYAKAIGDGE